ncbi:MAG: hypothetical protein SFZ24_08755 [Planctomycetota bacterium]|nr:hypothetical protein [Planctomycetota bacterium]
MKLSHRTRRSVLLFIASVCLLLGALVLYGQRDVSAISTAGSPALAALLGLIVLPGVTLAARRMDRRLRLTRC